MLRGETPTDADGRPLFKLVDDPRVTRVGDWLRAAAASTSCPSW